MGPEVVYMVTLRPSRFGEQRLEWEAGVIRTDRYAHSGSGQLCFTMPRKPNYSFEKRRKEQERQKKTEAKREEKLRRKEEERAAEEGQPPAAGGEPTQ